MNSLNAHRHKIAALQAERSELLGLCRNRAMVMAAVDAWLAAAEAQGQAALELAVNRAQAGQAFAPCHIAGNAAVIEAPGAAPFSVDLGPLLVALIGAKPLRKHLAALVNELPEGLGPDAKAQRLHEIGAILDELEAAEEALIVELELAGEDVLRRADARPEIVLA